MFREPCSSELVSPKASWTVRPPTKHCQGHIFHRNGHHPLSTGQGKHMSPTAFQTFISLMTQEVGTRSVSFSQWNGASDELWGTFKNKQMPGLHGNFIVSYGNCQCAALSLLPVLQTLFWASPRCEHWPSAGRILGLATCLQVCAALRKWWRSWDHQWRPWQEEVEQNHLTFKNHLSLETTNTGNKLLHSYNT